MGTSRNKTIALGLFAAALAWMGNANAVPSYSRQMNMECSGCHTRFPQLNSFGRAFKLGGYTLAGSPQIEGKDENKRTVVGLDSLPPVSLMFQTSLTHTSRSAGTQNPDVQFPQQLSLFVAGRIAPQMGAFLQLTYEQEGNHFGLDNTEFRYARSTTVAGGPLQWGLLLNNNPTMEDLWNSTPVWGFPWASSAIAPSPSAGALVDGQLGQGVAGVGMYGMWDNAFYGAFTLYRSAKIGELAPTFASQNTIDSVAPYWRLAWQHNWGDNYLEIGTYGLWAKLIPVGITGPKDTYTDVAGDFQYEHPFGAGRLITVHGTIIHEHRSLDASIGSGNTAPSSNNLDTYRVDAGYISGDWQGLVGYFRQSGDTNALIYGPSPIDGSRTASPDSHGFLVQGSYFPWRNVQVTLQYRLYGEFNGAYANYDGAGRTASDNDTLYLLGWFAW
jgi:hypothetical protein